MPPDLLPRPPRRVRGQLGGRLWFGRIFMMPHLLVGIIAIFYWIFLLGWVILGRDIPGTVTDARVEPSTKHGQRYSFTCRFNVNGRVETHSQSVDRALYDRYEASDKTNFPVTVHYLAVGPLEKAALPEGGSIWVGYGFVTIWVFFWNFVVSIFVYQLWIQPLRTRRLYKYGDATGGTVLRKRTQRGKSTTYYVTYAFDDPYTGQRYEREMVVWKGSDYDRATIDQMVTVLFWRENPKRSTVYEFGGYTVAGVE